MLQVLQEIRIKEEDYENEATSAAAVTAWQRRLRKASSVVGAGPMGANQALKHPP